MYDFEILQKPRRALVSSKQIFRNFERKQIRISILAWGGRSEEKSTTVFPVPLYFPFFSPKNSMSKRNWLLFKYVLQDSIRNLITQPHESVLTVVELFYLQAVCEKL